MLRWWRRMTTPPACQNSSPKRSRPVTRPTEWRPISRPWCRARRRQRLRLSVTRKRDLGGHRRIPRRREPALRSGTRSLPISKPRHGPVAFPYLWDIWRLSWVQYNAFQAGWLSKIAEPRRRFLASSLRQFHRCQDRQPEPRNRSDGTRSRLDNSLWMETTLSSGLRAPLWPSHILGPIDQAKAERGKTTLHRHIAPRVMAIKELPNGFWDVDGYSASEHRTDPNRAANGRETPMMPPSSASAIKWVSYEALHGRRQWRSANNYTPISKTPKDRARGRRIHSGSQLRLQGASPDRRLGDAAIPSQ